MWSLSTGEAADLPENAEFTPIAQKLTRRERHRAPVSASLYPSA